MKKEVACQVNALMLDFFAKLNASVKLVQDQCNDEEFKKYRSAVGQILGAMAGEVMIPLYEKHPDLEPDGFKNKKG
jgi:hypothetical protein